LEPGAEYNLRLEPRRPALRQCREHLGERALDLIEAETLGFSIFIRNSHVKPDQPTKSCRHRARHLRQMTLARSSWPNRIGAATVFLVAHLPVSYAIGAVTLLMLLMGYGASLMPQLGRAVIYLETICLTVSAFLLMVPAVSETLRRVPDGHPLVTDPGSPLLIGAQALLLAALIAGVTAQVIHLRRRRYIPMVLADDAAR